MPHDDVADARQASIRVGLVGSHGREFRLAAEMAACAGSRQPARGDVALSTPVSGDDVRQLIALVASLRAPDWERYRQRRLCGNAMTSTTSHLSRSTKLYVAVAASGIAIDYREIDRAWVTCHRWRR